ncbi:6-phospho-3-hexuloisomerase [Nitratifractor salsuginis]|uniref:6-phospho 3-hexuloisomerase n=1 Tax=Nitratifractor salsuginis (strain DSM 16511 / JCM 12458 / E9I37-1) TaxID=749222 RepID=E6X0X7_NITSE|nr:6-phospho-3-hexuloisomerase [Nitratifractor salsuginis]ADV46909.1 6-phospho 3-hexuloisomerase [Nitratifractor salsuginis DSM 16511]
MIAEEILNDLERILSKTDEKAFERFLDRLQPGKRIFIAGAGRSGYVGKCFAMRLMHLGYEAFVVGETNTPSIRPDDLLLAISSSGTTDSVVNAAKKALSHGAETLALTADTSSPLAQKSDFVIYIPSNDPKEDGSSPLPLGSKFELSALLFLEAAVSELMKHYGITEEEMKSRHSNL